jgi:hypothetical protein
MTRQLLRDPDVSEPATIDEAEDIESELFSSSREAGVSCLLMTASDIDEDTDE